MSRLMRLIGVDGDEFSGTRPRWLLLRILARSRRARHSGVTKAERLSTGGIALLQAVLEASRLGLLTRKKRSEGVGHVFDKHGPTHSIGKCGPLGTTPRTRLTSATGFADSLTFVQCLSDHDNGPFGSHKPTAANLEQRIEELLSLS